MEPLELTFVFRQQRRNVVFFLMVVLFLGLRPPQVRTVLDDDQMTAPRHEDTTFVGMLNDCFNGLLSRLFEHANVACAHVENDCANLVKDVAIDGFVVLFRLFDETTQHHDNWTLVVNLLEHLRGVARWSFFVVCC